LDVTATTLKPILVETIAKDSHFRTDRSPVYTTVGRLREPCDGQSFDQGIRPGRCAHQHG
jgi:hypothetical protein